MAHTTTTLELTVEADVMSLTGFSLDEILTLKHEQGIAFLHWYFPTNPVLKRKAESCKTYWGWWKNLWQTHDEVFVYNLTHHQLCQAHVRLMYNELHSGRAIANEGEKLPNVVITEIFKTPCYA